MAAHVTRATEGSRAAMQELSDAALLDHFIDRRDEAAFAAIVQRHGPMVWGVCRRIAAHHQDAEEAFQAAFLVLARKADSVRPRQMVANWLHGVARRTAMKARDTCARRRTKEKQVTNMPDPAVEPRDSWQDLEALIDQELAGLPDKYRIVILLCDLEGNASYEILSVDKPNKGYGVGVYLTVSPAAWKTKRATVARCWTAQDGSGFQPAIIVAEPQAISRSGWTPSETMKGQLRLRREGATLFYLVNEDLGQPFREIFQCDYGKDDIDLVRLVANPGGSSAAMDIRLLDVQMQWDGPPDHARTAPLLN